MATQSSFSQNRQLRFEQNRCRVGRLQAFDKHSQSDASSMYNILETKYSPRWV